MQALVAEQAVDELDLVLESFLFLLGLHIDETFFSLCDFILLLKGHLFTLILEHALAKEINGLFQSFNLFVLLCSLFLQTQDLLVGSLDVYPLLLVSQFILETSNLISQVLQLLG